METQVVAPPGGASAGVRGLQVIVVSVCMLINILDGYDLQVPAFTSTRIMADWGVAPAAMGLLFSAGLLGVGLGSFLLAPIADRVGRRPSVLLGLTLITLSMLAVGITSKPLELGLLRLVTGLGIGILLPTINTLVSEYTPARWQSIAVSLYAVGYPIGAAASGVLAPYTIEHFGWRAVYLCGGLASALLIVTALAVLPESLEFLLSRQPSGALARARRIAARLQLDVPQCLPVRRRTALPSVRTAFQRGWARRTLLISAAYFLLWLSEFFVVNWTPAILTREGATLAASARGGVMLQLGGMAGALLVGVAGARFGLAKACVGFLSAGFLTMIAFGFTPNGAALLPMCALLGFLLLGATVGLYALVARLFSLELRATGTGVALAFGRAGAVVGLSLGGYLIGRGWPRGSYVSMLALPVAAAALATFALRDVVRGDPS